MKSLSVFLAVAGCWALVGSSLAQDDTRTQELESLRNTVQQLEKSLQEVRTKLAELENQNRAKVETNVAAAIAKEALKTGGSVYNLVIAKGWLTKDKLDELLKPENMTHPRLTR